MIIQSASGVGITERKVCDNMRLIDADAIEYTHAVARNLFDGHNWNELVVTKDEIEDMPTIQPDNGLQSLADEIATFKRCVKSENSDYLTGYLCALSVVEGMIADMRGKQDG